MKLEKGKLFWKLNESPRKIRCLHWDENNIEYYSFLKEKKQEGYRQVIISSEIFTSLLRFIVVDQGYSIINIKFMEEDDSFIQSIDDLISKTKENPSYFAILLDELKSVSEKSSIEIKKIDFKNRIDGIAVKFFIQSNGLIGVNSEAFNLVTQKISSLVERCLFP